MVCLNPLKTRKSFRHDEKDMILLGGIRRNPLKTRKSFRQNKIFHRYGYYWCLNPLKTRKSFRPVLGAYAGSVYMYVLIL